ncbi:TM2 domain-containing protein [Chitinophaga sp. GCM10012297]|uniref:TM2 domain-containing protein n=1 Tax=Chitinophaga chungangae TaxID=2821488 RepID=A0ABS3YEA1_9BACT|nr:TM2 domain-containing protein [Chitinophaga chungangae]MBO9153005.1 TM2 domain-containing protein [Chitinophaga chungangae]
MNDFYFAMLPGIDHEELIWLEELTKKFDAEGRKKFLYLYQGRRKDPQTVLLTCLIGFIGPNGIHRFMMDQILMGLLFLFTFGFCLIGTIIDAVNYRKLTWEYNKQVSLEVAAMIGKF